TLSHYDSQHYPFLLHAYGPELGVSCLSYLAHVLWILGYPDQALERSTSALSRAQELAHPFSVALALDYAALFHQFCGDRSKAAELAGQTSALCEEYGFQYYSAWTPIIRGWTQVQTGLAEDGAKEIRLGLNALQAMEAGVRKPYFFTLLAQASLRAG